MVRAVLKDKCVFIGPLQVLSKELHGHLISGGGSVWQNWGHNQNRPREVRSPWLSSLEVVGWVKAGVGMKVTGLFLLSSILVCQIFAHRSTSKATQARSLIDVLSLNVCFFLLTCCVHHSFTYLHSTHYSKVHLKVQLLSKLTLNTNTHIALTTQATRHNFNMSSFGTCILLLIYLCMCNSFPIRHTLTLYDIKNHAPYCFSSPQCGYILQGRTTSFIVWVHWNFVSWPRI